MLKQAEELFASYKLDEARPLFQKAAEEGESRAYYFLGQYTIRDLSNGLLGEDLDTTFFEKGAQAGDPLSGIALLDVTPAEDSPEYDKYKVWLKELEEMAPTDMFAAYELGSYYLDCSDLGDDIDQALKEKGIHWLTWSAEKGYWKSCLFLGRYYNMNSPGETDQAKSIFYYKKAKDKGLPEAYYVLGASYYIGNGIPQDEKKALKFLKIAADKGQVQAAALLGKILCFDKNKKVQKEAFKYTKIAAEAGFGPAMWRLGVMYSRGMCAKKDLSLAKKWYQKAAAMNLPLASVELAFIYHKEGNDEKAFETVKVVAEKGSLKAMTTLALFYGIGIGTEANPLLCKIWMQKAASAGAEYAQQMGEILKYMATPENMVELLEMLEDI